MTGREIEVIDTVMRILSADGWLADFAWSEGRGQIEHEWVGDELVPIHVLRYVDRAEWDRDRSNRRYGPPFHRSDFRILAKGRIVRPGGCRVPDHVVSTPHSAIDALVFERDGSMERIEFHALHIPYARGRSRLVRRIETQDMHGIASGNACEPETAIGEGG